jgi:hypothetical protein
MRQRVRQLRAFDGRLTVIRKRQSIEHLLDLEVKREPF